MGTRDVLEHINAARCAVNECYPAVVGLYPWRISVDMDGVSFCGTWRYVTIGYDGIDDLYERLPKNEILQRYEKECIEVIGEIALRNASQLADLYDMTQLSLPIVQKEFAPIISKMLLIKRHLPLPIGQAICDHLL